MEQRDDSSTEGLPQTRTVDYSRQHIDIISTTFFDAWLTALRDRQGRLRILARLDRLSMGNFGDAKAVGGGVFELRMTFGPGYRVYFLRAGRTLVLLLCGGDKSTQSSDISRAREIASDWYADQTKER